MFSVDQAQVDGMIPNAPGYVNLHNELSAFRDILFTSLIVFIKIVYFFFNLDLIQNFYSSLNFESKVDNCWFRTSLTDVATYGHIPVPLVYTQVTFENISCFASKLLKTLEKCKIGNLTTYQNIYKCSQKKIT